LQLADEVHWLIENKKVGFILSSSSARKLKRGKANLLGGRAWLYLFYPLVYKEIPDFDLLRALNHGLLPKHYLSNDPYR
jgi:predicted AAA+ superfamily ATPase